jgi:hypothetical protein
MKALSLVLAVAANACLATALAAQDTTSIAPDTGYVEYHDSPISLPLGIGLRIPTYDRVNGLTLPWGPKLEMGDGRVDVDGLVSYRSNLGKWDPSIQGTLRPSDQNEITFFAGQGTFSNDEWIRSDLSNSVVAFFAGTDARNYYRSTRGNARYTLTLTGNAATLAPFLGVNLERDWSTGSIAASGPLGPNHSPWSVFGRNGNLKMRRPNPIVAKGSITSLIGGTGLEFVNGGLDGKFDLTLERSLRTSLQPECLPIVLSCFTPGDAFTQGTLNGRIFFPTFGSQTFTFRTHLVLSNGPGITPTQRFVYLGGTGTLSTVNLLALGGDRLLFIDGDYMIPIEKVQIPIIGSPFLALHYAAGNAGIDRLPPLIQNVGVGVGVSMLRADFMFDPAQDRSPFSRRSAVSFGLNLSL